MNRLLSIKPKNVKIRRTAKVRGRHCGDSTAVRHCGDSTVRHCGDSTVAR